MIFEIDSTVHVVDLAFLVLVNLNSNRIEN